MYAAGHIPDKRGTQVKLQRIVILIAAIVVLAPVAALAQQPVASFHHRPSANSALNPKGPAPNLAGKWDILSTDSNGDPYNTGGGAYLGPIEFTVDFTETGGSTLTQVDGNTFTSSACSADGTATVGGAFDGEGNSGNGTVQFIATVDNGYTYTFSGGRAHVRCQRKSSEGRGREPQGSKRLYDFRDRRRPGQFLFQRHGD
jgi:hypothetical protein